MNRSHSSPFFKSKIDFAPNRDRPFTTCHTPLQRTRPKSVFARTRPGYRQNGVDYQHLSLEKKMSAGCRTTGALNGWVTTAVEKPIYTRRHQCLYLFRNRPAYLTSTEELYNWRPPNDGDAKEVEEIQLPKYMKTAHAKEIVLGAEPGAVDCDARWKTPFRSAKSPMIPSDCPTDHPLWVKSIGCQGRFAEKPESTVISSVKTGENIFV
eukprot:gene1047-999_t